MGKYLIKASYTQSGLAGLQQDGGTGRRAAIEKLCASLGGTLESFYFAFGETDAFVIMDAPDNVSAAAASVAVNAAGAAHAEVTVLLTPEEMDEATQRSVDYIPPGG